MTRNFKYLMKSSSIRNILKFLIDAKKTFKKISTTNMIQFGDYIFPTPDNFISRASRKWLAINRFINKHTIYKA